MSVKHDPVTLLLVVQTNDGQIKLLIAEGASVPGQILKLEIQTAVITFLSVQQILLNYGTREDLNIIVLQG
jgi:hypothetical protein